MTAHDTVMDALRAIPKPLDRDTVLAVGKQATAAAGERADQFEDWFKHNGDVLMRMLTT